MRLLRFISLTAKITAILINLWGGRLSTALDMVGAVLNRLSDEKLKSSPILSDYQIHFHNQPEDIVVLQISGILHNPSQLPLTNVQIRAACGGYLGSSQTIHAIPAGQERIFGIWIPIKKHLPTPLPVILKVEYVIGGHKRQKHLGQIACVQLFKEAGSVMYNNGTEENLQRLKWAERLIR